MSYTHVVWRTWEKYLMTYLISKRIVIMSAQKNNKSQLFGERERKGVPFAPSTSETVLHAPHVATS